MNGHPARTNLVEPIDFLHPGLVFRRLFRHIYEDQGRVRFIFKVDPVLQQVVSFLQQISDPKIEVWNVANNM